MGICCSKGDKINETDKIKKFLFKTSNNSKTELTMDSDKTIVELIIAYFKNINKIDLIEDERINFSYNGKKISPDQTDLIKEYFKNNKDYYIIDVLDNNNLISNPKKIFKINLQTTSQEKAEVFIEGGKTLKELRLEFFKKINRLDLFGDKEIYFLFSGKNISLNQNNLVGELFKEAQENQIIVIDNEDKISNKKIEQYIQQPQNLIDVNFMIYHYPISVTIDKRKTMGELIIEFFNKIMRHDLFYDEDIRFISNGKFIGHYSKDIIKEVFYENFPAYILVDDFKDKIHLNPLIFD